MSLENAKFLGKYKFALAMVFLAVVATKVILELRKEINFLFTGNG